MTWIVKISVLRLNPFIDLPARLPACPPARLPACPPARPLVSLPACLYIVNRVSNDTFVTVSSKFVNTQAYFYPVGDASCLHSTAVFDPRVAITCGLEVQF